MIGRDLIVQQMANCLFALNRPQEVQELLKKNYPQTMPAGVHYQLVLALIGQNRIGQALDELLAWINSESDDPSARKLAFELIIRKANQQVANQEWEELGATLNLAALYAPDSEHAQAALAPYRDAMPLFHLRAGDRQKTAAIWQEQLAKHPEQSKLLHNLAVLYYFWAQSEEDKIASASGEMIQSAEGAAALWSRAAAFQVALMNCDKFWQEWLAERSAAWGRSLTSEEIARLRKEHLVNALQKPLQKYQDGYETAGNSGAAERMDEALTWLQLEQKSATWWKTLRNAAGGAFQEAIEASGMAADSSGRPLLMLDAGALFFEQCGLLPEMKGLLAQLGGRQPENVEAALLALICESHEAALLLATIEERKRPTRALESLKKSTLLSSHHAAFLRALALLHLADEAAATAQMSAVDHWEACQQILQEKKNWKAAPALEKFLQTRFKEQLPLLQGCAQKWVNSLGREEIPKAIKLLDRCLKIDRSKELLDMMASLYCDQGSEKLAQKRYEAARSEYRKALEYSKDYSRAKDGMCTCYNNEAVDESNLDKAIALYEKAYELNPADSVLRGNFASSLNAKAVNMINSAGGYASRSTYDTAIRLLRRACILDNPQVESLIGGSGALSEYMVMQVAGQIRNAGQKQRLDNLATAIRMRNNS